MLAYPAVLHDADADGIFGCEVPDLLINASGRSADEAIRDAGNILHELLQQMDRDGEPFPEPTPMDDIEKDAGTLVLLTSKQEKAA
ncbi:MAG: hypothetical protein AAF619_06855 [Pseudomonadota bacterium]